MIGTPSPLVRRRFNQHNTPSHLPCAAPCPVPPVQFQTTTQQVIEINPTLAAGGILTPGSEVFIPP